MRALLLLFIILVSSEAFACSKGDKECYTFCLNSIKERETLRDKNIKITPLMELKFLGKPINNIGEVAELFAANTRLLKDKSSDSDLLYLWDDVLISIDTTAKIEKIEGDFYYVSVTVYDGANSCAAHPYTAKVEKVLKGYIHKTNPQGLPSLWTCPCCMLSHC